MGFERHDQFFVESFGAPGNPERAIAGVPARAAALDPFASVFLASLLPAPRALPVSRLSYSGLEAYRRMRGDERWAFTPVIMVSGGMVSTRTASTFSSPGRRASPASKANGVEPPSW